MKPLMTRPFSFWATCWGNSLQVSVLTAIAAWMVASLGNLAVAQDAKPPADPETFRLQTKDRVPLNCRYFPGSEGKQTVPVILVHGWEGSLEDYQQLASMLQAEGHAVIVPDLRGHGESLRQLVPGSEEGIELKPSKMRKADFVNMVRYDLEAVKKFLIEENNKGKLNIELLAVVGSEMGALIATNWTARDWSFPNLPSYKQGQDVKAFVLISPLQSFRGLTMREALTQPNVRADLNAMILFGGRDSKAAGSARRVFNSLKKFHQQEFENREEEIQKRDLYFHELDTSLQGTKLLKEKALAVDRRIATFLKWRLVDRNHLLPWALREKPTGN